MTSGKNLLRILILLVLSVGLTSVAYSQTGRSGGKKKKKTRTEVTKRPDQSNEFLDRVWVGGVLSDFSFFNNSFRFGITPMAAFELNHVVSIGPFVRMAYRYERFEDPIGTYSYSTFDVGPGIFARFHVFQSFFAQVEYESAFLEQEVYPLRIDDNNRIVTEKNQQNYVYLGIGYNSGGPKSKFSISLHYNVLDDPATYVRIPWDFRIGMLFNIGPGGGAVSN